MKQLLHAGNVVLIGFGCMVLFMGYRVFQCIQNPFVLVSDNYYQEEMAYQGQIDARTNTVLYNDSIQCMQEGQHITLILPASLNTVMDSAHIKVYNQSDSKKDKEITLERNASGEYTIPTISWEMGTYKLKLSIRSGGKDYYKEFNHYQCSR